MDKDIILFKKYLKKVTDSHKLDKINIMLENTGYYITPEYPKNWYKGEGFKGFEGVPTADIISMYKYKRIK